MRRRSTLDRAAEQIVDGAADATDLVTDVLADVAHGAVETVSDLVSDGGEALAAASLGRFGRTSSRKPKALLAILIAAIIGAWLYRRFMTGGNDPVDDATEDVSSLRA